MFPSFTKEALQPYRWALLSLAILSEVSASLSLKGAMQQPIWYFVVVIGYAASFALLAVVLRVGVPLGVAYGIWGAMGVALTALFGAIIFEEVITPPMLVGILLIVGGVVLVEKGSHDPGKGGEARL